MTRLIGSEKSGKRMQKKLLGVVEQLCLVPVVVDGKDLNAGYRHRRPGFYDASAVSDDTATDFMVPEVVAGRETGYLVPEESLTDQSQADDADINVMIRKFGLMQVMATPEQMNELAALHSKMYSEDVDYRASLDFIREAKVLFEELPALVRKEFDNDPMKYVEAFSDGSEENKEKLTRLGLLRENVPVVESPELSVLKEIRDGQRQESERGGSRGDVGRGGFVAADDGRQGVDGRGRR